MNKKLIPIFRTALQKELQLSKPVRVCWKKRIVLDKQSVVAVYMEGAKIHTIQLSKEHVYTDLELFASLAHEYVHAWQAERGLYVEHDKRSAFKYWTKYFQKHYGVCLVGSN